MLNFSFLNKNAGIIGPITGVVILVTTVSILVLQMTIRPWATDDYGQNTHLNTTDEWKDYTRTDLTYVGDQSAGPDGWVPSELATQSQYQGFAAFVAYGCASCHAIDGTGTTAGPSINGTSMRRLQNMVRKGPKSMPLYAEHHVSEAQLEAIAGYLMDRPEATPEPALVVRPTATPFPAPTATMEPTAVPVATQGPQPTAIPGSTATPVPPTPKPKPAVDPAALVAAQRLFFDVGCDICHGEVGEGAKGGPSLEDLTAEQIRDFVRNPQRPAGSSYSEAMDAYDEASLSDAELDEIIFFLLNRE